MTGLTFDSATHTYRYNGLIVPGVTTILAPLNDFDRVPPHILSAAAKFGKAVHLACELDDLGDLDEDALDSAIAPYLSAWRKFSIEHEVEWERIEQPVFNKTLRYAGTLDRQGRVKGLPTVLDIKSGANLHPSVGPQLAAYQQASELPSVQRIGVQLKPDGTYVTKIYTDPTDWPVFASLLTLRTWCARHDITPNFKA